MKYSTSERKWLTKLREKKNMTHAQVAEQVGISRAYYTAIESGTRRPSPEVAQAIAKALAFDWTIFFKIKSNVSTHEKELTK